MLLVTADGEDRKENERNEIDDRRFPMPECRIAKKRISRDQRIDEGIREPSSAHHLFRMFGYRTLIFRGPLCFHWS